MFDVKLEYCFNSKHTQQIFTGFTILRKQGLIKYSEKHIKCSENIQTSMPRHVRVFNAHPLTVTLNKRYRLCYDTHDSWEIERKTLDDCDFYFKRSCSLDMYKSLGLDCSKIYPLGLNYRVLPNDIDLSHILRQVDIKDAIEIYSETIYTALAKWTGDSYKYFVPTEMNMSQEPVVNGEPKVLFMARTWDPYDDVKRSKEKIEMRCAVNESRAVCIKSLRKEFGSLFYGGFSHTAYAKAMYPNLLLPNENTSIKRSYIGMLREFPICISTTGLHGSIGWKMGEYVAFSKAIVSERLQYDVPGNFEAGKNYLEFTHPDQCVESVASLIDNTNLRILMMNKNREYYLNYLRPDRIILNTLHLAITSTN
ncbi:hypothetical protein [Thiocapsa imhoffii]|uniref:hypothetical protein n=1 Tax=Thiocapsa imhoffii TaxID=382777 RepID=UPI001905D58B|nr:hypothetical protein [Thiocapsa imhoffii]